MLGFKKWTLTVVLLATPSFAITCSSGDCQQGKIAGPYTTAQVAELTTTSTSVFGICQSSSCTGGSWNGDQIEGIDAQQNIGGQYQFYGVNYFNIDANIAVGPTVSGQNAQVLEWVNGTFVQAFDKVTGQPIFTFKGGTTAVPRSVAGLWSGSTQAECQDSTGNVQVIYDRMDNAFVISRRVSYFSSGTDQYAWCIAASSGSDLSSSSTKWYAYEYKMAAVIPCVPNSSPCTYYFPDWPRIGTWSNGFYITFDLQDPATNYTEAGFEACQLDRADIAQGKATNPMTCYTYTLPSSQWPSLIHSVDVADIDSATGPTSGEAEIFRLYCESQQYPARLEGPGTVHQPDYALHVESTRSVHLGNERTLWTHFSRGEPIHAGLLQHLACRGRSQHFLYSGTQHQYERHRGVWQAELRRL